MSAPQPSIPERPPFALRARLLTPLDGGGAADVADGLLSADDDGRIEWVGPAADAGDRLAGAVDLRPLVLLPGLIDLHAHLPQLPNAGLGFGTDLLPWLERYIFPLEDSFRDPVAARRFADTAFRAFAAAGTTTLLAYTAVFKASADAAFEAAEAHGIRAILGKVMMDRVTYDKTIPSATILDRSLREASELIERWHGAADGRLGYAVTPRFAVSCSADLLRESAALAAATGTWWQTHVAEDVREIAEVRALFPEARDYVDVYERAGGLGSRSILAHAVHLSDREVARLVATGTRVAHCPESNLFLDAGVMPLARYLEAGLTVGLGTDVAGGPELSLFSVMRAGAYAQVARRALAGEATPVLGPLEWLRLATLDAARALGLDDRIGSLEAGKEADVIAVDARLADPLRREAEGQGTERPESGPDLVGRLVFRPHAEMVRAAWVRGRRLEGPG